jgi:hypothetical protein
VAITLGRQTEGLVRIEYSGHMSAVLSSQEIPNAQVRSGHFQKKNIKKDIEVSKDRLSAGSEITEIAERGFHVFQVNEAEFHQCRHIQIESGDLALVALLDSGRRVI